MSIRIRRIVDSVSTKEACASIALRVFQTLKEDVSQYEKMFSLRATDAYMLPMDMKFRVREVRGMSAYLSRSTRREKKKTLNELSKFLKEALEEEYKNEVYVEVSDTEIHIMLPADYFAHGQVPFVDERA